MQNRVFLPNMMKEIHEYIKSCDVCQKHKYENQKPVGLLGQAPTPSVVFQSIHIDFIGPLPPSYRRRNQYVLVVLDDLSKWPEFFSMTIASAKKVATCLEDEIFY